MMSNSAIYALGDITVRFSGLLLIPLYTRYLTPDDYGLLSIANTLTAILAIFMMLSLMAAFTRFYFDCDNREQQQRLLSSLVYVVLAWAAVLTVVLFLVGETLFNYFIEMAFYPYIALAIVIALAGLLPQVLLSVLQVQEKVKQYALFTIVSFVITSSFVIYHVVFLDEGAAGSLTGTLTGALLMSVVAIVFLKKNWLMMTFEMSVVKSSLNYSLPLVPHLLLIWVMMGSDLFVLQYFRPMSEVGIYSLGYTLGFAFFVVTGALSRAWSPIFYRSADNESDQIGLSQIVTTMLLLMLLVVTCSMIFLQEAVKLITVEAFYDITLIIPWVALSAIFHVIYISFVNVLFYDKKNAQVAIISACAALVNVLLNVLFIPKFGMQAAAVTTALAYLLQMGLICWFANSLRHLHYHVPKLFWTVLVCIVMYSVSCLIGNVGSIANIVALKVLLIIAGIWTLYYAGILSWKDVEALRAG